jgi:Ni/Co efflux regulator RcnB
MTACRFRALCSLEFRHRTETKVKRLEIATFAAALLMGATAYAADRHPDGSGAPHGGATPHAVGGGHAGGFSHGAAPSFSRASEPNRAFNGFSRGTSERRGTDFASYSHGSNVRRATTSFRTTDHGMEEPRGRGNRGVEASYTHERGAYGSMEHGASRAATGGTPHYAHDSRGFGERPSNWNQRPRNFDRGSYQRNVAATARFHYGSYDRPSGWYYRRWAYGDTLPSVFWARNYWLTSWWMFDLAVPPYGYEWVRYGDDALLINVDTGQILQVDYGVFY